MKDFADHAVLPMDGATLAEVMRQRGINMRYLGKVLDLVVRSPARDQLDHIYVSGAQGGCGMAGLGWRPGPDQDSPLCTLAEDRHRRAHHPLCQAHLQDVLTGTALPPRPGPWGCRGEPGW